MRWISLTILLLSVLIAKAQSVFIFGPFSEPGYPTYVSVFGEQFKTNTATIEASNDMMTWREGAVYDCADNNQFVYAAFNVEPPFPSTFFRSRNDPCAAARAASPAPLTETRLYRWERKLRFQSSDGRRWKLSRVYRNASGTVRQGVCVPASQK